MKTFLNIFLTVPVSFPRNEIMNGSYEIALLAFFASITIIFIALLSGKRRNSKSVKTGKFKGKRMIFQ